MLHPHIRCVLLLLLVCATLLLAGSYLNTQPSFAPQRAGPRYLPIQGKAAVTRHIRPRVNHSLLSSRMHGSNDEACAHVKARDHLVFIKTHKTGSTTMTHIINRFGYTRNLSFTLNRARPYSGHLGGVTVTPQTRRRFLPSLRRPGTNDSSKSSAVAGGLYDILNIHLRHNKTGINTFMAQPTHYISILRDPGYQFESAFTFFGLHRALLHEDSHACRNLGTVCFIKLFFHKPEFYRRHLRGTGRTMIDNGQIFDLGLDRDKHGDPGAVHEHIARLESEMDLVLITEYFDESLLLLRRLMCWDWSDIVYLAKNVRSSREKVSEELRQKMRKFNSVDMRLYKHFNKTLWHRIEQYGPSFRSDLENFRAMLNRTARQCTQGTYDGGWRVHPAVVLHEVRPNATRECALIAQNYVELAKTIWKRQSVTTRKINK